VFQRLFLKNNHRRTISPAHHARARTEDARSWRPVMAPSGTPWHSAPIRYLTSSAPKRLQLRLAGPYKLQVRSETCILKRACRQHVSLGPWPWDVRKVLAGRFHGSRAPVNTTSTVGTRRPGTNGHACCNRRHHRNRSRAERALHILHNRRICSGERTRNGFAELACRPLRTSWSPAAARVALPPLPLKKAALWDLCSAIDKITGYWANSAWFRSGI